MKKNFQNGNVGTGRVITSRLQSGRPGGNGPLPEQSTEPGGQAEIWRPMIVCSAPPAISPRPRDARILAIREGLFGLEKNRMIQTGEKAAEGRVALRSGKLRPQRGRAAILKVVENASSRAPASAC